MQLTHRLKKAKNYITYICIYLKQVFKQVYFMRENIACMLCWWLAGATLLLRAQPCGFASATAAGKKYLCVEVFFFVSAACKFTLNDDDVPSLQL